MNVLDNDAVICGRRFGDMHDCFTPSHFAEMLHPKISLICLMADLLGIIHLDLLNLERRHNTTSIHWIFHSSCHGHLSRNDWALVPTFTHRGSCSSGCTSWPYNDTQKVLKSELPRGQVAFWTVLVTCYQGKPFFFPPDGVGTKSQVLSVPSFKKPLFRVSDERKFGKKNTKHTHRQCWKTCRFTVCFLCIFCFTIQFLLRSQSTKLFQPQSTKENPFASKMGCPDWFCFGQWRCRCR